MDKIINGSDNIVQSPGERAAFLDSRINANARIAAESIAAVGRDLKIMRDEKLYTKLGETGYDSFENYCNSKVNISLRSAYNFIRIYETYGEQLDSIQYLGITKLVAMTALEAEERGKLIESGEAERLSSRELEKKIEEMQKKCDQLTLMLDEAKHGEDSQKEEETLLRKQNEGLLKEIEALKIVQSRQEQDANNEKKRLKSELELLKRQKNETEQNKQKAAEEIKKQLEAAIEKQREEEKKKHAAEIEKFKNQIAEAEKKSALQAAKKQTPPDSQKERVKFYCEECLKSFNSAMDTLNNIENGETKEKCRQAVSVVVKKMEELIK